MDEQEWLADRFEEHRAHLRAAAHRMLGSLPVMGFTVIDETIVEIDAIADPDRVNRMTATVLGEGCSPLAERGSGSP